MNAVKVEKRIQSQSMLFAATLHVAGVLSLPSSIRYRPVER